MNPYELPTQTDPIEAKSPWPRLIDWFCWAYPFCFAVIAIGTTLFLRASRISIGPMQYDTYFKQAGASQQFWYSTTLTLIFFSPIAALLSPWLQLVWLSRPMRQRVRYFRITVAAWLVAIAWLAIAGVPILDFLVD